MMAQVYVGVGSNIAREQNIRAGVAAMRTVFGGMQISPMYETPAMGFVGDPFYNLVVLFETELDARAVKKELDQIEQTYGRDRSAAKFSARTLDLDLLLWDDIDLHAEGLDVPRHEILKYAFVLGPLAELAPEGQHPQSGASFASLWARMQQEDPVQVQSLRPVVLEMGV
jgi:2-amino-4-hydroxy-6-hydroxymethyldihydropteridine diphosphokinase